MREKTAQLLTAIHGLWQFDNGTVTVSRQRSSRTAGPTTSVEYWYCTSTPLPIRSTVLFSVLTVVATLSHAFEALLTLKL